MLDISIVGAGRMGCALALALDQAGHYINRIVFRTTPAPDEFLSRFIRTPDVISINEIEAIGTEVVFICTQDSEISSAAIQLETLIKGPPTVFITSGALS